jgi:hypothetical protein
MLRKLHARSDLSRPVCAQAGSTTKIKKKVKVGV